MKLMQCPTGHYYDQDKYTYCPYCSDAGEMRSEEENPEEQKKAFRKPRTLYCSFCGYIFNTDRYDKYLREGCPKCGLSRVWLRNKYGLTYEKYAIEYLTIRRICAEKKISILGDSISTFSGFNPEGYQVFYDPFTQRNLGVHSVNDTWWKKVLHYLDAGLCVNASYSGRRVSGSTAFAGCSLESIRDLSTKKDTPQIILIWLGINDWGFKVPVNRTGIAREDSFDRAYRRMLSRIRNMFPKSRIVCGTLMETCIRGSSQQGVSLAMVESYNTVIRQFNDDRHIFVADLGKAEMKYETEDGIHPTGRGHGEIARAWITAMKTIIR